MPELSHSCPKPLNAADKLDGWASLLKVAWGVCAAAEAEWLDCWLAPVEFSIVAGAEQAEMAAVAVSKHTTELTR